MSCQNISSSDNCTPENPCTGKCTALLWQPATMTDHDTSPSCSMMAYLTGFCHASTMLASGMAMQICQLVGRCTTLVQTETSTTIGWTAMKTGGWIQPNLVIHVSSSTATRLKFVVLCETLTHIQGELKQLWLSPRLCKFVQSFISMLTC